MNRSSLHPTPIAALALLVAILGGCAGGPPSDPAATVEAEGSARRLLASGQLVPAADEYLRLANATSGDLATGYRLDAIAALIEAREYPRASDVLNQVKEDGPSPALATRVTLLDAELAVVENRAGDALNALSPQQLELATPEIAARMRETRARAYTQLGNHLDAARERVLLELSLTDPVAQAENREKIWESLSRLPADALRNASRPAPDTFGGWVELAIVSIESGGNRSQLAVRVDEWRLRYPGHPAGAEIVSELLTSDAGAATKVALLLPLGGTFEAAAEAVRDGFMAAWFDDPKHPEVTVHDTTAGDIRLVYDRAVESGADFVIGPLQKSSVTALSAYGDAMPVTTLALNQADPRPPAVTEETATAPAASPSPAAPGDAPTALPEGFYQFSLAPEDEARRVAEKAREDGHSRAAIFAPEGEWGDRVADAFATRWRDMGGVVAANQRYPGDARDMSDPVVALLNVEASKERGKEMRRVLSRKVHFSPRRRGDLELIFLAAYPRQGRQIRPQLDFYDAADIEVYSTSHIFTGRIDPLADIDVERIVFGAMPWMIEPSSDAGAFRRKAAESLSPVPALARLNAFGVDAYRLTRQLGRLNRQPSAVHDGVTGELSMGPERRIVRQLSWARFVEGVPRPLGYQAFDEQAPDGATAADGTPAPEQTLIEIPLDPTADEAIEGADSLPDPEADDQLDDQTVERLDERAAENDSIEVTTSGQTAGAAGAASAASAADTATSAAVPSVPSTPPAAPGSPAAGSAPAGAAAPAPVQ